MTYSSENKVDGIVLVTDDAKEYLNPRQEITYREHRRELTEWMLGLGKTPEKAEGETRLRTSSSTRELS